MSAPSIAQIAVGLPLAGPFDYLIPDGLSSMIVRGARVLVRFAGKKRIGIVVGLLEKPVHQGKLSVIIKALDEAPVLSEAFLELSERFAARFACSQGEALELFLPAYLRGDRGHTAHRGHALNSSFELSACHRNSSVELLLDRGQTKRWDVLVPRIARTLNEKRGVLVLVPDATRCPEVLPKLGPLLKADERVLLTQGTEKEEYARWQGVHSGRVRLAVGFISAVFAPVQDLGLIVVVDEESPAYRSDQSPFYHAREVALLRAAIEGCDVICVSSAPSVEMWHAAQAGRAALTILEEVLPAVRFMDLTNFKMKKGSFIPLGLRNHIEATLKEGGKVLLYIQAARGVAGIVAEVKKCFPLAAVAGYDKASAQLPQGLDILVATQAILRHRAQLKFALSVVLDIDWEFHKHDHQAAHSAFALAQHLRQMTEKLVLLQTRHAADPLLHTLACAVPDDFYRQELALRREMGLPPYAALVTLVIRAVDPELACAEAKRLYDILMPALPGDAYALEPQPDRTPIIRGKFRHCVILGGPSRERLVGVLKDVQASFRAKKGTVITVNVQ